jgi:hypothetical protein
MGRSDMERGWVRGRRKLQARRMKGRGTLTMGIFGDVWRALSELFDRSDDRRRARRITQSDLSQMRGYVDEALLAERWPASLPRARWEDSWGASRKVLGGSMNDAAMRDVDRVYSFAHDMEHSVDTAGAHAFDSTSPNPGEDKDFLERFRAAIDRAEEVLR